MARWRQKNFNVSVISRYEEALKEAVDAIFPDGYTQLEQIATWNTKYAHPAFIEILRFCCEPQNLAAIDAGRKAFKRLPSKWVTAKLERVVEKAINLEDSWEYRRLLEILVETKSNRLAVYVNKGLLSGDPEIREAAADMSKGDERTSEG